MAKKYKKHPIVIEALQLTWDNWDEMCTFAKVGHPEEGKPCGIMLKDNKMGMRIPTLEGEMKAEEGDYIVKGIEGELYPVKESIFNTTYEEV